MNPSSKVQLAFKGTEFLEGLACLDRIAANSSRSIFREPVRIGAVSAWWGHVPFAHWLVHVVRPNRIVELGTHNGVSYGAFCSSVEVEGLICECTAIDTWQGDHQAGFFDDHVFEDVQSWHDDRYKKFSSLMRSTFDAALPAFQDGSIDLLHIDGLHTYDAVRHDFETWLPKLSRRGLVLLHDTAEHQGDFGVWRLWAELKDRYPSFEFQHSHGLGVLAVGPEVPTSIQNLCDLQKAQNDESLQGLFAAWGRRWSAEGLLVYEWQKGVFLRESLAKKSRELEETQANYGILAEKLSELLNSTSWRITQPARNALTSLLDARSRAKSTSVLMKRTLGTFARRIREFKARPRVKSSSLFDASYYLTHNPDVAKLGIDPLSHFLRTGWRERRDPSSKFSISGYLEYNPDIRDAGINPLVHYVVHGRREGRIVKTVLGEPVKYPKKVTPSQKSIALLAYMLQHPRLAIGIVRESRRIGLRQAAALAWQSSVPPKYSSSEIATARPDHEKWLLDTFHVVPYHLNPYLTQQQSPAPIRLAIHLHLYYEDMIDKCTFYLQNIPVTFDLFVSVPSEQDLAKIIFHLTDSLPKAHSICVESVPNRGRDIAPLIVQFGDRLKSYDIVAHFHTKKSPHNANLATWFEDVMDTLCGSVNEVKQILNLLTRDAKSVYPSGNKVSILDTGWSDNFEIAAKVISDFNLGNLNNFPRVEFPQGAMFWARTSSLEKLLSMPLQFSDFPEEPIGPDGTLAHALERLVLILGLHEPGRNYRLETRSLKRHKSPFYEAQHNFSQNIMHRSAKVLAYYLPQFHPTPENSLWHGDGFTEWYKVRAAYPLFQGHYQQHFPHPDVSYYLLESSDVLKKQAEMMRQAGIYGMIFYHYWFSGRLILEKPAQILLSDPTVQMPFCFCWANENWTRRWDGNEREILLEQVYSAEDALAFIRYLIPFFRDERYINIAGRPVLFVYRPSSIPPGYDYINIWRRECELAGLPFPYVVAVLTRGATSPKEYGMDAGAERVLHDWMGSAARDIRSELTPYWPLNGGVLDYEDVAKHYAVKARQGDFPLFRSIVPVWDNTARYGSDALLLHNFKADAMQSWVEQLIQEAECQLPENQRFLIVNAWNEWAEGAHLEPDMRFGYAYLNAIGRALSHKTFNSLDYITVPDSLSISIEFGSAAVERLRNDLEAKRKFVACLRASNILKVCRLSFTDTPLAKELDLGELIIEETQPDEADFKLRFEDLYLFPPITIERLLQMGLRYPGRAVCGTVMNDPTFMAEAAAPAAEISFPYSRRTGMELQPLGFIEGFKICGAAPFFKLGYSSPIKDHGGNKEKRVSTVIRYHAKGNKQLLINALFSLLSQDECDVRPYIGVQDLALEEFEDLVSELKALPWPRGCDPVLRLFRSSMEGADLRSLMLNELLREAPKGYVGFLDFDDIVFPYAYISMVKRLRKTDKNATFGRVFSAFISHQSGMVYRRDVIYNYGFNYADFLDNNHAPLHSFLIDTRKIEIEKIKFFSDMRFMEDYYLTLQIFSPSDTDWESLTLDNFIGDYNHFEDAGSNTLAITDTSKRKETLDSLDYKKCLERIHALKSLLHQR